MRQEYHSYSSSKVSPCCLEFHLFKTQVENVNSCPGRSLSLFIKPDITLPLYSCNEILLHNIKIIILTCAFYRHFQFALVCNCLALHSFFLNVCTYLIYAHVLSRSMFGQCLVSKCAVLMNRGSILTLTRTLKQVYCNIVF